MKLKWKMDSNGTYFCEPSLLGHDKIKLNISVNQDGDYELRELNLERSLYTRESLDDILNLAQRYYDLCVTVIKSFCIVTENERED